MKPSKNAIASALGAILAMGSMSLHAEGPATEKCAGVVKAGQNDCGSSMGGCHGSIKTDGNAEAWIELPAGTCAKIIGARVTTSPYAIPGGKAAYEKAQRKS